MKWIWTLCSDSQSQVNFNLEVHKPTLLPNHQFWTSYRKTAFSLEEEGASLPPSTLPLAAAAVSPEPEKAPQPNKHTRVSKCTKIHKCGPNGCPQSYPLRLINNNKKRNPQSYHSHGLQEKKLLFFLSFFFFTSLIGEAISPGKCFMASGQSRSVDNAS